MAFSRNWTLLPLLMGLLLGCASNSRLVADQDYDLAARHLKKNEIERALESFPEKEKNGFITTLERAWLGLWNRQFSPVHLGPIIQSIDARKQVSLSREARGFFFSQTEDGYIPGEHEIIVLHLVAAMQFLRLENWEAAKVEARRAAFFLQSVIPESHPKFDDPALRLWLAAIWISLGDWESARVDLRVVNQLAPSPQVEAWLDLDSPPKNVTFQFDGIGPAVLWRHPDPAPILEVEALGSESRMQWEEKFEKLPQSKVKTSASSMILIGSAVWYARHRARNDAIRDIILKSNYMTSYYAFSLGSTAQKGLGYGVGGSIELVGGALESYKADFSGTDSFSQALGMIFVQAIVNVAGAIAREGGKFIKNTLSADADRGFRKNIKGLEAYRFVRFLPNWMTMLPVETSGSPERSITVKSPESASQVQFINQF